jgi:predicted 3-demethylubiquinone-9 3-methyltransferase (glyoxalase superfamily)
MTSKAFTTCLWFDNQGEEAARYYVSIFKDSRLGAIHRYTSAGPGQEGAVMVVEFELNGQRFVALNAARSTSSTRPSRSSSSAPARPRSTNTGTGWPRAGRRSPAAG